MSAEMQPPTTRRRTTLIPIAAAVVLFAAAAVGISMQRGGSGGVDASVALGESTKPSSAPAPDNESRDGTPPTASWENISPPISLDFAAFENQNYGAQTIALSPSEPSIVYLGTCYQGIWRTTDAGETWTKVSTGRNGANLETGRNWTLAVDPTDADTVYTTAGFGFEQGLWKSVDGGVNWRQTLSEDIIAETTADIYSVTIDPKDPEHLLLGSHSGWGEANSGVLESRDGGRTWIAHAAESSWNTGHYVFFVDSTTWLVTTQYDGVWRTEDSGDSWKKVSDVSMQHGGNQVYGTSSGVLYLGGAYTMLRSTDEGRSWSEVGPDSQDGYNGIIGDGEFLYAQAANTGLNTVEDDPPYVISPEDDGRRWVPYNGGEQVFANGPMAMAFDPVNRILYSSNWGAGVWKLEL